MKLIIQSVIIFILLTGLASANWVEVCSITLHPNQNQTCADYTISNHQFSAPVKAHLFNGKLVLDNIVMPSVLFTVSGHKINESLILTSEDPVYDNLKNNVRIAVSDFTAIDSILWEYENYNPSVKLYIYEYPEPYIEMSIQPELTEYSSGQQVKWIVNIQNTGSVDIPDITIPEPGHADNHSSLLQKEKLQYNLYTTIPKDYNSAVYYFNLSATVEALIIKEKKTYTFNKSSSVNINPPKQNIYLYKSIGSRIYTENNTVILSLSNSGSYRITAIEVSDQYKTTGIQHKWNVPELNSSESLNLRYTVDSTIPGSFDSPAASASFEINNIRYNITSNKVTVNVVSMRKPSSSPSVDELYVLPVVTPASTPVVNITVNITTPAPTQIPTPIATTYIQTIPGFNISELLLGFMIIYLARRN